ncbi:MAG: C39 family peptidase [Spirochaetales bacterium]|nr:C39 family peptidase [Spirochaetales bacterium]
MNKTTLSLIFLFGIFFQGNLLAQDVALKVPLYDQGKDSEWADEKLGSKSDLTIKSHGCALTCISMVLSYFYNEKITPPKTNKWLKKHDGFDDGWSNGKYLGKVNIKWPSLSQYQKGMVYSRFDWNANPADTFLIRYYLEKKIPIIAEVIRNGASHYIVITGWNDKQGFMMNDPAMPEETVFNNYYNVKDKWGEGPGRNIYGIRVIYPTNF